MQNAPSSLRALWRQGLSRFTPVYFILVMSTGIVSIAAEQQGFEAIARALFAFNLIAYAVIWLLTLIRLVFWGPGLLHDLLDANRGFGFLTLVAGTCVLGVQLIVLANLTAIAAALWALALVLWLGLLYTFFTVLILREQKPGLAQDIHGGWLIAVVSTQALCVLGTMLAPQIGPWRLEAQFATLCLYLLGAMIYGLIIPMIFERLIFFTLTPTALRPLNWIDMGASAITVLAGDTLVRAQYSGPLHVEMVPILKASTVFFWVGASWWIPLLLILGFWRHLVRRFPFTYDLQYWGMVFPIGMYAACTEQLAIVLRFEALHWLSRLVCYVAIAAWLVVCLGMLRRLGRALWGIAPPEQSG
ncbi:MAG TPA: tellurite resistance/C4-dicarboxylate transporter family protein [Oscillatoriaceae cyanobacterium]